MRLTEAELEETLAKDQETELDENVVPDELTELLLVLDDREQRFALHLLNGYTQAEAYRRTHPSCADTTARVNGHHMVRRKRVRTLLAACRQLHWREEWLSYSETRTRLARIARDETLEVRDRMAAMALDARMGGYFERGDPDERFRRKALKDADRTLTLRYTLEAVSADGIDED